MGLLHKLWDETVAGPAPENDQEWSWKLKLMVDSGRILYSPVGSSIPGSPLTSGTPSEAHATSLNACDWIVLSALDR